MNPPAPVTSTFLPLHMNQRAPGCCAGDIAVAAAHTSPVIVKDRRSIASCLVLCIVAVPLQRRIVGDEGVVVKPGQLPQNKSKTYHQAHCGSDHITISIEVRTERQKRHGKNAVEHKKCRNDLQGWPAQIEVKQEGKAE